MSRKNDKKKKPMPKYINPVVNESTAQQQDFDVDEQDDYIDRTDARPYVWDPNLTDQENIDLGYERFVENKKKNNGGEYSYSISDIAIAEEELRRVKKEYGVDDKKHNIITRYFDYNEKRQQIPRSKKKYILLLIFTGWCGGHRFYAHMWISATIYLVLFWTGLPIAMSVIDLLSVAPKKKDENGMIML